MRCEFIHSHTVRLGSDDFSSAQLSGLLVYAGTKIFGMRRLFDLFNSYENSEMDTRMRRYSDCDEFQSMVSLKGYSFSMNFTLARCFSTVIVIPVDHPVDTPVDTNSLAFNTFSLRFETWKKITLSAFLGDTA